VLAPDRVGAIREALRDAERVMAITHVSPDGDAIGSLLGLGLALRQLGKSVILACDDPAPATFDFLAGVRDIRRPGEPVEADLIVALDCGDQGRMGNSFAALPNPRPPVINIDHHVTNTQFGAINLVPTACTSTAEVLVELFGQLDLEIDQTLATCLLTGIVTDTLGFRTVSVTPRTIQIASELMDAGADLAAITMQALNLRPLSTLRLYQKGLAHLAFQDGLLWTSISHAEQLAAGYDLPGSSSGLVSLLGNTQEAAMGVVLMELADGQVNVSFRCRPPWDVAELATSLGGGGHQLAAGCTIAGPLDAAAALVVSRSLEAIERQRAGQGAQ
jgi:phosphoesterase RecJ-like protein